MRRNVHWSSYKVHFIIVKFSRKIIKKYLDLKFYENPCSGRRLFLEDEGTDLTKLTVSFRC
jgi:hypothetical protein